MAIDLNSSLVSIDISGLLRNVSLIGDISEKISYLKKYLHRLEEELMLINGLKHQLPLCVSILEEVIEKIYKEIQVTEKKSTAVTKEFLPLKSVNWEKEKEKIVEKVTEIEKIEWMKSAQLWTNNVENFAVNKQDSASHLNLGLNEMETSKYQNPYEQMSKRFKNSQGRFVPFQGPSGTLSICRENSINILPQNPRADLNVNTNYTGYLRPSLPPFLIDPSKKPRRSWSVGLHRKFMVACQKLGGAYVATPKQIKETMAIDDLTNDEIKSHLQKYRMHIRKNPPASGTASASASAASAPSVSSSSWMGEGPYATGRVFRYSASPESSLHIQRPFSGGFIFRGPNN